MMIINVTNLPRPSLPLLCRQYHHFVPLRLSLPNSFLYSSMLSQKNPQPIYSFNSFTSSFLFTWKSFILCIFYPRSLRINPGWSSLKRASKMMTLPPLSASKTTHTSTKKAPKKMVTTTISSNRGLFKKQDFGEEGHYNQNNIFTKSSIFH